MYKDKRTRSPLSAFIVRMTCKERHNKGFGTWLWASSTVELSFPIFSVITLRKVIWNRRFGTTVSICPAAWPLKVGHIGCSETSVSNHFTPHINPEDRIMWFRTYVLLWLISGILWRLLSKRDAFLFSPSSVLFTAVAGCVWLHVLSFQSNGLRFWCSVLYFCAFHLLTHIQSINTNYLDC